jgi:ATP-binding cassette, subfamily B, bacterial MsbA
MTRRGNSTAAGTYGRLLAYVRPHWRIVAAAILATGVVAGANAMIPVIMRNAVGGLESGTAGPVTVAMLPVAIVAIFVVRGIMDFVAAYGLSWVGRSGIRELRSRLFAHYLRLPAAYLDTHPSADLLSKLTYNTEQVATAMSNAVVMLLRDSLTVLVLVGVMLYMSPQLSLMIALVAPTIALLVAYMNRAFRRYSTRIQNSMGDVTRVTEQALAGQRIIKIFGGEAQERTQFDAANGTNYRMNMRLIATRAAGDALTQYAIALGTAAVIYASFSNWLLTDLDAAVFAGFVTAMGMLFPPFKRLVNVNVAVQRGIAAAQSLFAILDEATEPDDGPQTLERAAGAVEYRHVSFRYREDAQAVLDDVNLTVAPGSTVAVVGRSGSGKSTLVGLLPRFYDVSGGAVFLDGRDVRDYGLESLRRQISFVDQNVVLFDDSIAGNIAYGALADCSRADIEAAAEAAYVTEFAAAMPDGLDTQVGERGVLLSGGQRQRVAIARALLKNAPLLILDEATSALDTESERRIQMALDRLMQGRTTLVIAHRLSTVEHAGLIVVMHEGRIVERGTHEELLNRDGHYSMLYRMQFAD